MHFVSQITLPLQGEPQWVNRPCRLTLGTLDHFRHFRHLDLEACRAAKGSGGILL
jgi:hypothetical protein